MVGWMALVSVGRPHEIEGRSRDAAAASTRTDGGREAISDIFDFHHPRSLLWRDEREGKGLSYFIVVDLRPLCATDLACRKRRASPSFLRMRGERHECQSDVKASQFNSGLRP